MMMCETVSGVRVAMGNRNTSRKPAPLLIYLPQIPFKLTWAWTWGVEAGIRRLTTWALARPSRLWVYMIQNGDGHCCRYCWPIGYWYLCTVGTCCYIRLFSAKRYGYCWIVRKQEFPWLDWERNTKLYGWPVSRQRLEPSTSHRQILSDEAVPCGTVTGSGACFCSTGHQKRNIIR